MVSIDQMNLEESYRIREIDRSEKIDFIYKYNNGDLEEIKAGHECPNWIEDDYQEIISRGTAYGAYDGNKLVGFGVLAHKFRGKENNQLQIDLMYVTKEFRRQGIGRQILNALSEVAIEKGAKYLYISSTETESAVKFYSSYGSTFAIEVDNELFEKEPYDIHMLKKL